MNLPMEANTGSDGITHVVDRYITSDVLKPNKSVRRYLAKMWDSTDPDAQLLIRSNRAHVGIKCRCCGAIGYFQENCPNGCANRPPTPDSDDSPPPSPPPPSVGLLWNKPKIHHEVKRNARTNRIDISKLKEETVTEAMRLELADEHLQSFDFFSAADTGYNRSLPELTLHQVMRKLMRILKAKIRNNVERLEAFVDQTLLLPSDDALDTPDFPEKLKRYKEYRTYFIDKLSKSEAVKKQHTYQGANRPIDTLDSYFRVKRPEQIDVYSIDPKAGGSMHSKVGWKSITATGDTLAVSDPKMAARIREVEELCSKQGQWVPMQKASMKRKNDHFEHCAFVLRQEMATEHAREARILAAGKAMSTKERAGVWQERLASADRLMSTLMLYGFANGFDEADYLVYNLQMWKAESQRRLNETRNNSNVEGVNSMSGSVDTIPYNTSSRKRAAVTKGKKGSAVSGGGQDDDNETAVTAGTEASTIIESVANPYGMEIMRITNDLRERGVLRKPIKNVKSSGYGRHFSKSLTSGQLKEEKSGDKPDSIEIQANSDQVDVNDIQPAKETEKKSELDKKDKKKKVDHGSSGDNDSGDSDDDSSVGEGDEEDDDILNKADEEDEDTITSSVARSIARAKQEAEKIARQERRELAKKRKEKKASFVIVHKKHQRDIDKETMAAERERFKNAGLERHIRTGKDTDVAYLAPTLIPVPGTFEGDLPSQQLSSYVGQNIIRKVRTSLVRTDIGYTPQQLLPLYVRNTLREKNGTTPGGDQDMHVMAKDKRYSHYIGRPLNRFEPDKDLASLSSVDVNEFGLKIKTEPVVKELTERQKEKIRKKKLAMQNMPLSNAFVKMEFTKLPTLADLYYQDELLCESEL